MNFLKIAACLLLVNIQMLTSMEMACEDNCIVEWQDIDCENEETIKFIQPCDESNLTILISEDETKQISGSIIGNGRITFKSPSGIFVGKDTYCRAKEIHFSSGEGRCTIAGNLVSPGGEITLLGKEIYLEDGAVLDVSSVEGGGAIYIGEENGTSTVVVNKAAKLFANGQEMGSGGSITILSDEATSFHGHAECVGGCEGGDGGEIEISSANALEYRGTVSLLSSQGNTGRLLLDPKNAVINSAGTASATGNTFSSDAGGTVIISGSDLATALESANVTIQVNTDLIIDDNIPVNSGTFDLILQAGRSVTLTAGHVIGLQGGNVTITINDAGAVSNRDAGVAYFRMEQGSAIYPRGGDMTASVGNYGGTTIGEIQLINADIVTESGNLSLTGFGRQDGSDGNSGISVIGNCLLAATGTGTLTFNGTGGNGSNQCYGVSINGQTSTVATVSGDLTLIGTGGGDGSGNNNAGIYCLAAVSSQSGTIQMTGTGGSGADSNCGISLLGSITASGGAVNMTGNASASGKMNYGIQCASSSFVLGGAATAITMNGIGGLGSNDNNGIMLSGANIAANTGSISMNGTGRGTQEFNYGIRLESDAKIISYDTATIDLIGDGQGGTACNMGVIIAGVGSSITTVFGDISITGTCNGSTFLNQGVRLEGSDIISTGTGASAGNITLTGTGGSGTNNNNGVFVVGTTVEITSIDGNITLNGTGNGSGLDNVGVYIDPTTSVYTTGSGTLTINSTPSG